MSAAPLPDNEAERLAALEASGVLALTEDAELRRLAAEAARVAHAPMGLVSFVTADHQWIKAAYGADIEGTPRDCAFCAWAIYNAKLFWVEDALNDARFADNPLVRGEPHIRHYAGAPIVTPEGFALGAICALDSVPHPFDPAVAPALEQLAREVSKALGLHGGPAPGDGAGA